MARRKDRRRRRRALQLRLTVMYAFPFVIAVLLTMMVASWGSTESAPANDPGLVQGPASAPETPESKPGITIGTLFLVGIVGMAGGWLVAGRVLRPLRIIIDTANDISANSLDRRLGATGNDDEFTELAETLDRTFERLEAAFASQRRFVANASHELRTPLAAERALLQVALADPDATVDTLREACHEVLALGAGQERLVDALLTLASGEQGVEQQEPVDLADIAATAVRRRAAEAKVRGLRVDTTLEPAVGSGDPRLVESLVANLVDNAMRYNVEGGTVEVATSRVAGFARIAVRNTGLVVPPEEVDRLLQPFQRLEGQRFGRVDGHGLGLAIVRAIANAHGAKLRIDPRPEGGLAVEIDFAVFPPDE